MARDGVAIVLAVVGRVMQCLGYVLVILGIVGVAFGAYAPDYRSYIIRGGVALLCGYSLTKTPRWLADHQARILRGEAPKRRWF